MSVDEGIDRSLVEFAQKIAAIPKTIANDAPTEQLPPDASDMASSAAAEIRKRSLPPPLPASKQPEPDIQPAPTVSTDGKQIRHADEIAGLIMKSLSTIDGCPARGFAVTVYGSNPWNAMLTIRPEAGPRIDRELWRSRVQEIGVRLRNDFDVAYAFTVSTSGSS
ncbi:hypothetical protein CQ14_08515 [Bradyrhizobium lablabi]|uniref:Uncharacterized protein n=1 Tax=Bradyrhizobium lablabi TaxID=722472 RepID=A0A0R3NDF1_9BRAD|nr:hypothetical protein [Bradyrhizobium lablabi]KRR27872.1 hypothetical protein CQ14_08515 [Bradyrhizobium lablabi]